MLNVSPARRSAICGVFFVLAVLSAACGDRQETAHAPLPDPTASVNIVKGAPAPSMRVDVYSDATVSMSGFTGDGTTNYDNLLERLESAVNNGWKQSEIHYYKFGTSVREIQRPEFLTARKAAFYADHAVNTLTNINLIGDCKVGPQLGVVITDLFQSDGDINAIVSHLKEKCLQPGLGVGILAMKSQFDGRVFDARVPPFPYRTTEGDTASYRPFYALIYGRPADMRHLVDALTSVPFVSAKNFVLISDRVTNQYHVTLTKDKTARDINLNKAEGPYSFNLAIRKGASGGTLANDIDLQLDAASPHPRIERSELVVFRQSGKNGKNAATIATPSNDIVAKSPRIVANKLHIDQELSNTDPPGTYIYDVILRSAPVNGYEVPPFVHALSTDNPTGTHDANKTLNLEKFVLDLRQAASSIAQPPLAAWRLTVLKH